MHVTEVFRMNDWKMDKFLKVALSIQLLFWGLLLLEFLGITIPVIGPLLSFIYLIFLPGFLLLRIIKIHNLEKAETILYAIGLSIIFLMLLGLSINFFMPLFGVSNPISFKYLSIFISILVIIMCIICYFRDKDFNPPFYRHKTNSITISSLFLCLLPLMSILGTYLVNYYDMNYLLMILILIISIVPLLITFDKIPNKLYPFAVLVISISLLYHKSLISPYLTGWDINSEYYIANLTIINSYWNPLIYTDANSMLSITILPPIFYYILNIDLTWIFKVVYPLLYSLVPLGLFILFKKQTNDKIAFLAVFFFMSTFVFYNDLISLARQMLAELFLVLLLLVILDEKIAKMKRSLLLIIFAVSLSLSHYAVAYIYIYGFLVMFIVLQLKNIPKLNDIYLKYKAKINFDFNTSHEENRLISLTFVLFFTIFTISWYFYSSESSLFVTIVNIFDNISRNAIRQFLNPTYSQSSQLLLQQHSTILGQISKYLHLITQFLIVIGIYVVLFKNHFKFKAEYIALSILSIILLIFSIVLPFLAGSINTSRLYHIELILLAPFCIIGGIFILKLLFKVLNRFYETSLGKNSSNILKIFSIFLMIFLLFNIGFVNELTKIDPKSISLSKNSLDKYGDVNSAQDYYASSGFVTEQDVSGVHWISKNRGSNLIYTDTLYALTVFRSYGGIYLMGDTRSDDQLYENYYLRTFSKIGETKNNYLYLGTFNMKYGKFMQRYNAENLSIPYTKNIIYSNGNCEILF